jgi:hypothetical protein
MVFPISYQRLELVRLPPLAEKQEKLDTQFFSM